MENRLRKIRLFAMDVDGTLTDGRIYIGNSGEIMKSFSPRDGLGIRLLMKHDIVPAVITGRTSRIVEHRCREVGITELYQGIHNKDKILRELMEKYRFSPEETAYIGDDMNDLSAIRVAGVTFAPADCADALLPYIDIRLTKKAGDSPVREAIDMILDGRLSEKDYEDL